VGNGVGTPLKESIPTETNSKENRIVMNVLEIVPGMVSKALHN
jgi:hypothetical protein